VAGRPVSLLGEAVALVGDAVPVIGHALALVGGLLPRISKALALVGGPLALVSHMVALVGGPVAFLGRDLRLVNGGLALGQLGLGGLQRLFGGLGPGLGLPDPDVVQGQGGQPLALGVLDDLAGQLSQLAGGGAGAGAELLERRLGVGALGGGQDPFACSIQTRLVSACCSWATSSSRLASSTAVWTSSPAMAANSPIASSSLLVQVRGWVL
jgi:hypothetical protein